MYFPNLFGWKSFHRIYGKNHRFRAAQRAVCIFSAGHGHGLNSRLVCAMFEIMKIDEIIRSRRRSLAVEVTRDGRVVVRAPLHLSRARIDAFTERQQHWITVHLEQQRQRAALAPPAPTAKEIAALKARAKAVLPIKVDNYGRLMGLTPTGIKITSARTRYGSCSAKNALCFSCFLMDCPDAAIDLVVVHELAHILEKNHGPKFYALLGSVLPDYKERKKLLTMR